MQKATQTNHDEMRGFVTSLARLHGRDERTILRELTRKGIVGWDDLRTRVRELSDNDGKSNH